MCASEQERRFVKESNQSYCFPSTTGSALDLVHYTAPHTIRYTQMYVHPDYKPLSQSILFLGKAIKLQCEAVPEVPNATFRVETDNTPMVNFVNRRLAPHLENIRHVWRVSKCL